MNTKNEVVTSLLAWYASEARTLPWRSNPTPYRVWVSEMMLQQTRVDTVIPYFNRFMEQLPDVNSLATVDEEKLLKLWQGLGYYRRALNLKKAAEVIADQYQGIIPSEVKLLQGLPGIGSYSAGAISSIAYQKKEIVMDGNVLRVIARLQGILSNIDEGATRKEIQSILNQLIPEERPGDFNQALMELGATRCLPNGAPLCSRCPLQNKCQANLHGLSGVIPKKSEKKNRVVQSISVLLIHHKGFYAIEKRDAKGLLANMWALPTVPRHLSQAQCRKYLTDMGFQVEGIDLLPPANHIFTHVEWKMIGFKVEVSKIPSQTNLVWASLEEIETTYAVPRAFSYYLRNQ